MGVGSVGDEGVMECWRWLCGVRCEGVLVEVKSDDCIIGQEYGCVYVCRIYQMSTPRSYINS